MPASGASWKSTGAIGIPDKFPAGLRVLVVDDDPTCLMIIEKMLKKCNFEAIICNKAEIGLSLLRENKNQCHIVLSDVHMPDMDGFKLLEHIGLEMDLPVIMMSADDSRDVVMKGVTHGACDYIIKPVRIDALRNIWQHVVRRKQHKRKDLGSLTRSDDVNQRQKVMEDVDCTSSANEAHKRKNTNRREDDEDESEERDESSSSKKPRVVWTVDLHQQFVAAVNQLGVDKAVPKKILELMNVPNVSRENIASHLQKYRMYLKRLSESRHQDSVNTSFMGILDPGYDLRALAVSGQFPGQSLATVYGGSNNSRYSFPTRVIDQRNTFSFENSRCRPHLLHSVPANIEPNQFMSLHQPNHQSFNGFNSQVLIPMACQSQSQNQYDFTNRMLAHGLGSNVSNYMLSGPNQIIPNLGSQNMTFTDLLSRSSPNRMGPETSITVDDESGTQLDGIIHNQHDLLTAILEQPQDCFDGYASDDLPGST